MTDDDKQELLIAAKHWERLADEREAMAKWERDHGIDLSLPGNSVGDVNARTYRRCAKSLRLYAETGLPHCVCHLRPESECPNKKGEYHV